MLTVDAGVANLHAVANLRRTKILYFAILPTDNGNVAVTSSATGVFPQNDNCFHQAVTIDIATQVKIRGQTRCRSGITSGDEWFTLPSAVVQCDRLVIDTGECRIFDGLDAWSRLLYRSLLRVGRAFWCRGSAFNDRAA